MRSSFKYHSITQNVQWKLFFFFYRFFLLTSKIHFPTLRNKLSHSLCFGCRVWALKVPKASWVISHYIAVTEGCAVNTEIIWAMVNDSAVRATGLIKDRASCTRHLSGPWITHTHTHTLAEPQKMLIYILGFLLCFQASPHFSFSIISLPPLAFSPQSLLPSREEMAAYALSLNC